MMSKKYAIGVDLGGTNLRVALVSEEGEIARKVKKASSEEVFNSLLETIEEVMHGDIAGIGLGVAGLIDRKNGRVFSSPNYRAVEGLDLIEGIAAEIQCPCLPGKRRQLRGARRKGQRGRERLRKLCFADPGDRHWRQYYLQRRVA